MNWNRLFILLMSGMMTSCVYNEVQLKDVAFRNFNTTNGKMRATFDLEIENPNSYAVKLSKPELKVFVGSLELNDWSVPNKLKIKRRSKQSYPFYIEISAVEGLLILPRLISRPEIKIEGSIKAGTFIFGKRIPLQIKERLY